MNRYLQARACVAGPLRSRLGRHGAARRASSSRAQLKADIDFFGGVVIKEDFTGLDALIFEEKLSSSLSIWKEDNRNGVWLRLPIGASSLIPTAVSKGFWFHHCRDDYILLCTWLKGGKEASQLPRGPSHYIGVAGFVMNSQDELLMIKEKDGPAKARNLWKLPGGLLDMHENIADGVVREVLEETGLNCEYGRLAAVVESHHGSGPMRETSSDLYCISVLAPTDELQELVPQAQEIEACAWIPIATALSFPLYAQGAAFGESFRSALSIRNAHMASKSSKANIGMISRTFPVGIGARVANILYSGNAEERLE